MINIKSYAKINLFLDIKGKLNNGYHEIVTVMQNVDLYDVVTIKSKETDEILIKCTDNSIPTDEKNTCFKAAKLIKEIYHIEKGVEININKSIPSEAGMAGGSSNSAAVILGLNKLWNLNLSVDEILGLALRIGADVPFCVLGGTYLAEGIGEKLTKLNDFIWDNILIVKPEFSMSTAFVYKNLNSVNYNLYKNNNIVDLIRTSDYNKTATRLQNTLETVVEDFHPKLKEIKQLLIDNGALSSLMTGSGSAVFGLFEDKYSLDKAYERIIKLYPNTFKTKTSKIGVGFM